MTTEPSPWMDEHMDDLATIHELIENYGFGIFLTGVVLAQEHAADLIDQGSGDSSAAWRDARRLDKIVEEMES